MSCYGWERGTIVVPRKHFVHIVKDLVEYHNMRAEELYTDAIRIYIEMKRLGKGKHKFNYRACYQELSEETVVYGATRKYVTDEGLTEDSILRTTRKPVKPLKPRKIDFPKVKVSDRAIDLEYSSIEWSTSSKHVVYWDVRENNHSVDLSHDHPIPIKFFSLLDKLSVKDWGRGGGVITGNDEYNEESREAGDGGNYVVYAYGKKYDSSGRYKYADY